MPYKNPEDKQQWEREHREQRNAIPHLGQNIVMHLSPLCGKCDAASNIVKLGDEPLPTLMFQTFQEVNGIP